MLVNGGVDSNGRMSNPRIGVFGNGYLGGVAEAPARWLPDFAIETFLADQPEQVHATVAPGSATIRRIMSQAASLRSPLLSAILRAWRRMSPRPDR